ncbi:hypothetical protein DRP53_05320 [candidate division WOR-3 bacterium]|uniref:Uncharacterized protein n=1 Tax=candidate division WOR-3 bacterium TaxID=2052148 RepID=A0A660SJY0_UNCW3|nr:MAG: hypothetical protein DRP53_05320 [candidate division WOR-3 bacterium]
MILLTFLPLFAGTKSTSIGLAFSIGGTVAPIATGIVVARHNKRELGLLLGLNGIVFGPSLGHIYAGQNLRGCGSGCLRASLITMGIVAASLFSHQKALDVGAYKHNEIVALATGIPLLFSIIYDIATVPISVDHYNTRLEFRYGLHRSGYQLEVSWRW